MLIVKYFVFNTEDDYLNYTYTSSAFLCFFLFFFFSYRYEAHSQIKLISGFSVCYIVQLLFCSSVDFHIFLPFSWLLTVNSLSGSSGRFITESFLPESTVSPCRFSPEVHFFFIRSDRVELLSVNDFSKRLKISNRTTVNYFLNYLKTSKCFGLNCC